LSRLDHPDVDVAGCVWPVVAGVLCFCDCL
jgi:hypothetical protein